MNINLKYFNVYESTISSYKLGAYIFLFFSFFSVSSQITKTNDELVLFTKNLSLTNAILLDTNSYVNVGNQSFAGDLAGVRSFYCSGNLSIKHTNQSFSSLGMSIINGQFGPLINDIQARIRYTHRLQLLKNIQGALGTEIGFVNVLFKSTQSVDGGSDLAPDINLMLALFGKKWKVGTSLNHVTNPKVQPLNDQFRYSRNINMHGEYWFSISPKVTLIPAYQSIISTSPYQYRGNLSLVYLGRYELGTGIRNQGLIFNCGIRKLEFKPFDLGVHVGYGVPKSDTQLQNTNLFQIHLETIF